MHPLTDKIFVMGLVGLRIDIGVPLALMKKSMHAVADALYVDPSQKKVRCRKNC